jgi:hypothetical protein
MKKTIFCMNSADGQQLFVESPDLPCPIYEVNFKYPVPLSARSIRQPHPVVILWGGHKESSGNHINHVGCERLVRAVVHYTSSPCAPLDKLSN